MMGVGSPAPLFLLSSSKVLWGIERIEEMDV